MRIIANNNKFIGYGFNRCIFIQQTLNGWEPNMLMFMTPKCYLELKRFTKNKATRGHGKYFLIVLKELGL